MSAYSRWRERRRDKKSAKRLAAARAARHGKRLTLMPPEGVPLHFQLAGIGARLGAQLLDFFMTLVAAIVVGLALIFAFDLDGRTGTALIGLLAFAVRTPYYIVTELVRNGRTFAKGWLGLRTVSRDGRSLRAYQIVVRNLMREIEFFTPLIYTTAGATLSAWVSFLALAWIVVVVVVPWRSKTNQRLGDIIAGTAVIEEPRAVLLGDVARARAVPEQDERFTFTTAQLDAYGAYELQVLERILRPLPAAKGKRASQEAQLRREETMRDVAARIRTKIGYDEPVAARDVEAFLQSFYRAERGYLESRKLFGDARADKAYAARREEA